MLKKEKSITLRTTKENGSCKDANTTVLSDNDSNPNKEVMALVAKKFTRFFRKKRNPPLMELEENFKHKRLEINKD